MLIKVKSEECKFTIPIPLGLVLACPGLSKKFVKSTFGNDAVNISNKQLKFAVKELRSALKHSKYILKTEGLPFIDVKSEDGETVQIFL